MCAPGAHGVHKARFCEGPLWCTERVTFGNLSEVWDAVVGGGH